MDLLSGQPYWLYKNGLCYSYPRLTADAVADVLVLGGGITGALIAWHLARDGHRVVVVDRRHIGMGSTAGSTALLQYEIDTPLTELSDRIGADKARASYALCMEAVDKLVELAALLGKPLVRRRPSLYYASTKKDAVLLEREFAVRRALDPSLELWDRDRVRRHFPHLDSEAALWTARAAETDAYALGHELLQDACRFGAEVYDCTTVCDLDHRARSVEAHTDNGLRIRARKLVIACGYESQLFLPRPLVTMHSTYALVTKPAGNGVGEQWYRNCLIWETARPYLYARLADDGRIMAGGKDDAFYSPARRDGQLTRKTRQIEQLVERRLLGRAVETDFSWAGTFAETPDGLPYIGGIAERPNTWFAMGMGGNGIVFSILAAEAIVEALRDGRKRPEAMRLFGLER
jgi:glycine/D-amino acid oxidase-like deaminating enzyme